MCVWTAEETDTTKFPTERPRTTRLIRATPRRLWRWCWAGDHHRCYHDLPPCVLTMPGAGHHQHHILTHLAHPHRHRFQRGAQMTAVLLRAVDLGNLLAHGKPRSQRRRRQRREASRLLRIQARHLKQLPVQPCSAMLRWPSTRRISMVISGCASDPSFLDHVTLAHDQLLVPAPMPTAGLG